MKKKLQFIWNVIRRNFFRFCILLGIFFVATYLRDISQSLSELECYQYQSMQRQYDLLDKLDKMALELKIQRVHTVEMARSLKEIELSEIGICRALGGSPFSRELHKTLEGIENSLHFQLR